MDDVEMPFSNTKILVKKNYFIFKLYNKNKKFKGLLVVMMMIMMIYFFIFFFGLV